MTKENPIYSMCVCNYNMADTLERALTCILDQTDEQYEVVLVDDGSSDNSVQIAKMLQQQYDNLRLIELEHDKNRRLGITRNISIKEACGEYVLLHLDCDDVYEPYLKDFVAAFHQIEDAVGHDVLVAGRHINMARKDFLLEHGPYENMMRGEDRNLWVRMAGINSFIHFDHIVFCTRLPKTVKKRYMRAIYHTWDQLQNDFRSGSNLKTWLTYELFRKRRKQLGWKIRVLRLLLVPFAYVAAQFKTPYTPLPENMNTPEKFSKYREETRGTLSKILGRYGKDVDWSKISPEARHIFE